MKNLFIWSVLLIFAFTSCTEKIIFNEEITTGPKELTFIASNQESDIDPTTKTLVREGNKIFWIANDRISVIDADNVNNPFITKDGGLVANFKGTVTAESVWYCALYPYNSQLQFNQDTYVFTTKLYTHQYAEPDSYASGMNLAVARSANGDAQDLGFYNSASYLRVIIPSDYSGDDIYSMRLEGNDGELLAGDVNIPVLTPEDMYARVIDNGNAAKTIYLDQTGEGQACIKGKSYYFVLAPTRMKNGYTLTLVNKYGKTAEIVYPDDIDFSRNVVREITLDEVTFEEGECGEITSDGLFTVNSLDCLYEWANLVASGNSELGCYLTADIDFANDERVWPQIGSEENPYEGRIVGNGKIITNFKSEGENRFAGFVAVMGEGGSIENISFVNPKVSSTYTGNINDVEDDAYLGTIVGKLNVAEQFNYTTASIINCKVKNPTIKGGENVGGIVGRSFGRNDAVKDCIVDGGSISGTMFVGGIVGNTEGIIEDCHVMNNTVVSTSSDDLEHRIGGIVGTNNSGQIVACTANVTVKENQETTGDNYLSARYIGGIAGANNGTIVACAVSGTVVGAYGGALAGESYGDIYASYSKNIDTSALVYYIKRNMNNVSDVEKPTFKSCYGIGSLASVFVKGMDNGNIEYCDILNDLTPTYISNMNETIEQVAKSNDFEYGQPYHFVQNNGSDSSVFPYKAVISQ